MGEARRPGGKILVEAVDGVVARHVDAAGSNINPIVAGPGGTLRGDE